ncbi:haloalkane dehalogenase [Salinibacter sp. 10B]|uniref:alpha/beta fold hydrolase n=1 Tax=Salinibacter sp. 10B TaxID=1923971 RepID=UPI000CF3746D|nr:alpha/beta fold hydrolase [Salinibacter sp. 10B]PQJ33835.1 haloalkane dehalogenase [Salinibacter sp. 10B]
MSTETLRTPAGLTAYTDVGRGPPVVFVHGNPTSAHLYRHLIDALAPQYRCIAPDLLGFGRSAAPPDGSYRPSAHATRLELLLARLSLHNVTLVLHDWGGPIGLSYALRHPSTVQRLVLFNTWGWPLDHRPLIRWGSGLVGTPLGRLSIEKGNAFARLVMPLTLGSLSVSPPSWIRTYADALDSAPRRRACWTLARNLRTASNWLRRLWTRRARIRTRPALLCWGMKDPAFGRESTLRRWQSVFPQASTRRYPNVGHYVPEEVGPALATPLQRFLSSSCT